MKLTGSISILFSCFVIFLRIQVFAVQNVNLAWDASSDTNVIGYVVYYGTKSRSYTYAVYVGNKTNATITGVPEDVTYYFAVTAHDGTGLESEPSNEIALLVPKTPTIARPTVRITGQGTISPDYSTRDLSIGKNYMVAAIAGAGHVFAGWGGYTNSNSARVTFCMAPGLVLEANFIPSPFIPIAGNYTGLFYEADAVRHSRSGLFCLTATRFGTYSGRIQIGRVRYVFSGRLNLDCQATNVISRGGSNLMTLEFHLGQGEEADQVYGRVTDGIWSAALQGDRAVFNALTNQAPYAGNYTLVLQGQSEGKTLPAGDGYGRLRISTTGRLRFSGILGDNARISQAVYVSKSGLWPLYVPLYAGKGSVLGWLAFEDRPTDDIHGLLSWFRPADALARYYPSGFTDVPNAVGSAYVPPVGDMNSAVSFSNGHLKFRGGELVSGFTNAITLGLKDKVTNLSSNKLSMTLSRSSGKFSGRVTEPLTGKSWRFRGAVLQKANLGCGQLLGTNQTSQVTFTP